VTGDLATLLDQRDIVAAAVRTSLTFESWCRARI
jgi:hypothetical protein